ncbi:MULTISPECIES: hypothetical protein [unclassified Oerskovia]|uniref:hypothetical protein n=1 Tax=unclassified Oerskovia TaxID=2619021 RepID=UPI0012FB1C1B|nr:MULTISPECIES: hypothetical protein [unclassified Oerskovia]
MLYLFAVVFGAGAGVLLDHLKRQRASGARTAAPMAALVLAFGAGGGAFAAAGSGAPFVVGVALVSLPLGMVIGTRLRRGA